MNQRACILALAVCTLCTASMSSYAALAPVGAGDVPVSGSPNIFAWGDPATAGAGNLSSIGNRLLYTTVGSPTTSSPDPDFASLNWLNYKDVTNGSWTFEVNVSMPDLSSTLGDGQFVQYGLQAAGSESLNLYLEQFVSGGSLVRQFVSFVPGGSPQVSVLAPSDNDKLRFRFDGATQHLFAEFDRNADDGVDDWVTFGDLVNFDLSTISLFGESGFIAGGTSTTGPSIAAADGVGATVVPEPSTSAVMLAGLAALGWFGVRARRRAHPGPGLTEAQ